MKRSVGKTYCYDDFITDDEQKTLRQYILSIQDMMGHATSNGYKSEYDMLIRRSIGTVALKKGYNLDTHPLVEEIRNRIIEVEGICDPIIHDPSLGDWFGITDEDAFVEPHTDLTAEEYADYNVRRYNVIVSMPTSGGQPIYDGEVLDVGEKGMWMCEASLVKHASVINEGSRMRLNISYGFYVPKNQYDVH
jgi:hypothetical protein